METESKLNEIKKWIEDKGCKYLDIPPESVDIIHDCLILNKQIESVSGIVAHYYGFYYSKTSSFDKMEKYYLIAVESGISASMHNLARYYESKGIWDRMIKYYKMSIENGAGLSLNSLFMYYFRITDYKEAVKYAIQCAKNRITESYYYINSLISIGKFREEDCIELIDATDYQTYAKIVDNNSPMLLLYKLYKTKIDYIETALKYSPDWEGLKLAKEDFAERVINMQNLGIK